MSFFVNKPEFFDRKKVDILLKIFVKKNCFHVRGHISLSGTASSFYANVFDINFLCAFPGMEKKYFFANLLGNSNYSELEEIIFVTLRSSGACMLLSIFVETYVKKKCTELLPFYSGFF